MRAWCSVAAAQRSSWRTRYAPAPRVVSSTIAVRSALMPSPWARAYGQRSARSNASTLRDWAVDREDVRFRFRCTQCGKCCSGRGGRVRVNERELQQIAGATRESVEGAAAKYLRQDPRTGGWLLRQSANDAHCVFLDGNKCSIYEARPTQCRTYPWWPHHLLSDYDWRMAALECEGISTDTTVDGDGAGDQRDAYSFDDIAPQVIAHDIHRSGENYTHEEAMELLEELLGADKSFVDEFKAEFFAKFSRAVVFQDEELAVLDTTMGGDERAPPTRCLVFKNRLQLVQSEVSLVDRSSGAIDRRRLTLEVHRALCIPFFWLPTATASVRVAVLGAGAAALPLFLLSHLPQVAHVDAVEPNARVVAVAREFFGVQIFLDLHPEKLTLHEATGEDFVRQRQHARAGAYDLVIVDVDSGETRDDVAAPPPAMLSAAFLDDVKQQLTPGAGVAAFNVIALSPAALESIRAKLRAAFPHGLAVQLAHTKNAVFFLFNSDRPRARLTAEQLAQDGFQADTAQTAELIASAASVIDQW